MCSSPLPVGIAAYTASRLSPQTHSSSSSGHHTHADTRDLNPTGSRAAPQGTQGTQAASRITPESPAAQGNKHTQREPLFRNQLRQLGVHANAAWDETPELAGCGPLLPSWRHLADLLVPLLHRVRFARLLTHSPGSLFVIFTPGMGLHQKVMQSCIPCTPHLQQDWLLIHLHCSRPLRFPCCAGLCRVGTASSSAVGGAQGLRQGHCCEGSYSSSGHPHGALQLP